MSNNREKITKKDIKLVILGAVAGIVLTPAVFFLWRLVLESPTIIGSTLRHISYGTASNINENSGNTITFIIFLILTFFFIFALARLSSEVDMELEKFKEYEKLREQGNIENDIEYEDQKESLKLSRKKYWRSLFGVIIIELVFVVMGFTNSRANVLFDQFIRESEIIAPYISDQESKILRSQWRQMKNERDYEKITHYIDSVCTVNNLPKMERINNP